MPDHTILIVEDNPPCARLLHDFLSHHGYQPIVARTGRAALLQLTAPVPDLVLLDIQLPDMSGLTIARLIKADATLRMIPVVATSGYVSTEDMEKARTAGCDLFMAKPLALSRLLSTIEGLLPVGPANAAVTCSPKPMALQSTTKRNGAGVNRTTPPWRGPLGRRLTGQLMLS